MPATKIGGNAANILNCYFSEKKFTLWHIKLNYYIWKTTSTSHKQYQLDLLFCRNARKTHADQIIVQVFLQYLKRNVSQTFESRSYKNFYQVRMLLVQLASINFFSSVWWLGKTLLFIQFYSYPEIFCNSHVVAFFFLSTVTLQCH